MSKHFPIWQKTISQKQHFHRLDREVITDIAIIGGGITGLTAATELIPYNKKVCIIEAGKIGGGTSGYSTGNIYVPIQSLFSSIYSKFGKETTKTIINSRIFALKYIEQVIEKYGIDCSFLKRPLYIYTNDSKKVKQLQNELTLLKDSGLDASAVDDLPLHVDFIFAIKIENQARFNPSIYMDKLAYNLLENHFEIFEESSVTELKEYHDHCRIKTTDGTVIAKQVLVTTHIPKGIHKLHLLSFPYRSYAVAFTTKDAEYINGHFFDIDLPNYATSTHNIFSKDIDTIIVAGSHHKTGQPFLAEHLSHFIATEHYIHKHYKLDKVKAWWSAQHYRTADNIPYIGLSNRNSKKVYVATGYATDGLIYGTVAGIILSDLVSNKPNPWSSVYNSNRFTPIASFMYFIKENINVFLHYISGYIKNNFNYSLLSIKPGNGKIVNIKGKKVAAYRSLNGEFKIVSAICTHMKCVVEWNEAEKSWDCPCHGSRFTIDGQVIEGPALSPLYKITL